LDALTQVLAKLGELMLEAEALLMDIRVIQYDLACDWRSLWIASVACGALVGMTFGWLVINAVLR